VTGEERFFDQAACRQFLLAEVKPEQPA